MIFLELKKQLKQDKVLYLKIKAIPNSLKTEFKEVLKTENGDVYKISLKKKAIKNQANKELLEFLAKKLDTSVENVKIISGVSSKIKLIKISL